MNVLAVVNSGIALAIRQAGDAIVDVLVAAAQPVDAQPGEDYEPSWTIFSGKGFWEQTKVEDFPGTELMAEDRTMVLLKCSHDVDMHELVSVGDVTYHVYGVKADSVGSTRVLQKVLLRQENRSGIQWVSEDLQAA